MAGADRMTIAEVDVDHQRTLPSAAAGSLTVAEDLDLARAPGVTQTRERGGRPPGEAGCRR
jgi:hypothetical protein